MTVVPTDGSGLSSITLQSVAEGQNVDGGSTYTFTFLTRPYTPKLTSIAVVDSSDAAILLSPSFSTSVYVYRSTVAATKSELDISVAFLKTGDVPVSDAFVQYGSLSRIAFPESGRLTVPVAEGTTTAIILTVQGSLAIGGVESIYMYYVTRGTLPKLDS